MTSTAELNESIQFEYKSPDALLDAEKKKMLPVPSGYRILIAPTEVGEKTQGGLFIPEDRQSAEQAAVTVGMVLKVGEDAYADPSRFPSGPWCKEGDFVLFSPYAGTTFTVHGMNLRMINDDSVEAVVDDPRGVSRVVR